MKTETVIVTIPKAGKSKSTLNLKSFNIDVRENTFH